MKTKFTSTIAGATIFIASVSLIGRGLGFLREVIFAAYYGTGNDFDLYLVGAVLPLTIGTSFIYIGQNYFIPTYNKFLSNSQTKIEDFIFKIFSVFVITGILIAFLLFITANPIINLYLKNVSKSTKDLTYTIYIIFLFTLPFSAGIAILSAYLQSIFEYKYPTLSVLILNISTIVFVLLLGKQTGVLIIAIGYLVGIIFQFIYLLRKVKLKFAMLFMSFYKNNLEIRSTLNFSIISIVIIEVISQFYTLFDRYFYNNVSDGGIAALNYAQTLFAFPIGILSMALATAVFPKVSNAVKENKSEHIKLIFNESVTVILFLFAPISFCLIFYSDEIVKLILERGSFDITSTQYTSTALKLLSYSLFFYGVYTVINKIFYSIGLTRVLLIITIIGVTLKLLLNFLLVEKMQHNGLALATTISYLFFFVSCFLALNYNLGLKIILTFIKDVIFMVLITFFSYFVIDIIFSQIFVQNLIITTIQIFLFISIFILNLFWIKHPSMKIIFNAYNRFSDLKK